MNSASLSQSEARATVGHPQDLNVSSSEEAEAELQPPELRARSPSLHLPPGMLAANKETKGHNSTVRGRGRVTIQCGRSVSPSLRALLELKSVCEVTPTKAAILAGWCLVA